MQSAGGSKGGITKLFRGGDVEENVVRCKLFRDVDEVDSDTGCNGG